MRKNKRLNTKEKDIYNLIKGKSGITLIALVITIVILIILASISIGALFGDNGLINKANDAKTITEVAQEEEKLKMAIYAANISSSDKSQMTEKLNKALKSHIGEGKYILEEEDDYYYVTFTESNRKYKVTRNGEVYRRRRNRSTTDATRTTKRRSSSR